jgi:hypothetical protein
MLKKHFIVTFENDKAQTTETLTWARENFLNYIEGTTYEKVYTHLVDKKGFRLVSDDEKFVCYNFTQIKLEVNNPIFIVTDSNYQNDENFFIYFTIGDDEYNLSRVEGSPTLIKNGIGVAVITELKIIIRNRLELNVNIVNKLRFYNTGREKNTRDMATSLYNYLLNPNDF